MALVHVGLVWLNQQGGVVSGTTGDIPEELNNAQTPIADLLSYLHPSLASTLQSQEWGWVGLYDFVPKRNLAFPAHLQEWVYLPNNASHYRFRRAETQQWLKDRLREQIDTRTKEPFLHNPDGGEAQADNPNHVWPLGTSERTDRNGILHHGRDRELHHLTQAGLAVASLTTQQIDGINEAGQAQSGRIKRGLALVAAKIDRIAASEDEEEDFDSLLPGASDYDDADPSRWTGHQILHDMLVEAEKQPFNVFEEKSALTSLLRRCRDNLHYGFTGRRPVILLEAGLGADRGVYGFDIRPGITATMGDELMRIKDIIEGQGRLATTSTGGITLPWRMDDNRIVRITWAQLWVARQLIVLRTRDLVVNGGRIIDDADLFEVPTLPVIPDDATKEERLRILDEQREAENRAIAQMQKNGRDGKAELNRIVAFYGTPSAARDAVAVAPTTIKAGNAVIGRRPGDNSDVEIVDAPAGGE